MKMLNKFKTIGVALAIGMVTFACSSETQTETNREVEERQVEVNETNRDATREVDEFNTWVTTNTQRSEDVTAEEYQEMRAEYKRREAELEAESSTWDDETRRAWEETKREWEDFENSVQRRLGNIDLDGDGN